MFFKNNGKPYASNRPFRIRHYKGRNGKKNPQSNFFEKDIPRSFPVYSWKTPKNKDIFFGRRFVIYLPGLLGIREKYRRSRSNSGLFYINNRLA
jgi:hypothetical protein